nr:DUF72 domain-containing protein [Planctomycetota bacterium]
RFYPAHLRPRDWLAHYAGHFSAVEVTASSWAVPNARQIARWRQAAGPDLLFALKLWEAITYGKRLRDCAHELRTFLDAAEGLGASRGPLLVQLPPTLHRDPTLLADFLCELEDAMGDARAPVAVEFRSADWLTDHVYDLCDRHDVAICISDLPRCLCLEGNDADLVYVRRHGPDGHARASYPQELLQRDALDISAWLEQGRDVHVYFTNVVDGHAIEDARALQAMIGPHARLERTAAGMIP